MNLKKITFQRHVKNYKKLPYDGKKYVFFTHACKTLVCALFTGSENGLFPAPVRKTMALGCQVFHYSVKYSKHGLRGFTDAVQRRLATKMVIILTSCWQVFSEVELRRIFDVCKQWSNSNFACICKEKYGSIREATRAIRLLIVWKSSTYPQPRPGGLGCGFVLRFHTCSARTARFGIVYRNILFLHPSLQHKISFHVMNYHWKIISLFQQ